MEILSVDYSGYITIDKNDLVVFRIDPETGEQTSINPRKINTATLLKLIDSGEYYVDLGACFKVALDGEEKIEMEKYE
jgi:hypothetical protein